MSSFEQTLVEQKIAAHAVWRLLLSYRLGQVLASFKPKLKGTIQFEVDQRCYFALTLGDEPRWSEGIASEIDAWIAGVDATYAALLAGGPPAGELVVIGDGELAKSLFAGLASAQPARSLLALRSEGTT